MESTYSSLQVQNNKYLTGIKILITQTDKAGYKYWIDQLKHKISLK